MLFTGIPPPSPPTHTPPHHHMSLNREGRWGTTDDFATSPPPPHLNMSKCQMITPSVSTESNMQPTNIEPFPGVQLALSVRPLIRLHGCNERR